MLWGKDYNRATEVCAKGSILEDLEGTGEGALVNIWGEYSRQGNSQCRL